MTPQLTLWTYLWDVVDDGIPEVLDEIAGLGLNAISLATHYHSVEHLRPHTQGALYYRDESALYFDPGPRLRAARFQHRVSPLVARRDNPLVRVANACRERQLNLLSWTLACHSSHLGRKYPQATQMNCAGDRYPEALCPANPQVREFLLALVGDLSHEYGVELVELESCHYAPSRHYHVHEKLPMPLGPVEHFLLGLCFCPACVKRGEDALVDMRELRLATSARLRQHLAKGQRDPTPVPEVVAALPGGAAFVAARRAVITELMRDLRLASAAPISPIAWASVESSGLDMAEVAAVTDSLTICAYTKDPEAARADIRAAAAATGDPGKLRVGYHCFPPVAPDAATLMRVLAASKEEGVRAYSFYNYGIAPRPCLEWLRPVTAHLRG